MKLALYLTFIALLSAFCQPLAAQPFSTKSLEEVRQMAQERYQPYLVYVYTPDARKARKMARKTWKNADLNTYLQHRYLAVQMNALSPAADLSLLQSHGVYEFPSLLFFSPHGRLLGKTEGYLAPQTLETILEKHYAFVEHQRQLTHYALDGRPGRIQSGSEVVSHPQAPPAAAEDAPDAPEPVVVRSEEQLVAGASPVIRDLRAPQAGISRGATETILHLEVPGMEAYSPLLTFDRPHAAQHSWGLLIGSYTHFNDLTQSVGRFERIWHEEIFVFCEEVNEVPVYKLVLGQYADKDVAQGYADAIYRIGNQPVTLLDLQGLYR